MTNIITYKSEEKTLSKMEIINKTKPLYLCIDCEQFPTLCTTDKKQAGIYAKNNFCTISFYPIGTYTEIQ
jgi:hypothetical protein